MILPDKISFGTHFLITKVLRYLTKHLVRPDNNVVISLTKLKTMNRNLIFVQN